MAMDVSKFYNLDEFKDNVDKYIETMKNTEKAVGVEEIFMPGEIELRKAVKIKETGIPVTPIIGEKMVKIANTVGIDTNIKTAEELIGKSILNFKYAFSSIYKEGELFS